MDTDRTTREPRTASRTPLFTAILEKIAPHVAIAEIATLSKPRLRAVEKQADVPHEDLTRVVSAHRAGAGLELPAEVIFALNSEGLAIDAGVIASFKTSTLRRRIESAIRKRMVPASTLGTFDTIRPTLARLQAHNVPLRSLVETHQLEIAPALVKRLEAKGLNTLADVRTAGGAAAIAKQIDASPENPGLVRLATLAQLSFLGADVEATTLLAERGYRSLSQVANAPDDLLMAQIGAAVGASATARMKRVAEAQRAMIENVSAELQTDQTYAVGTVAVNLLPFLQLQRCVCEDCSSAVSPLAYLADLMGYASARFGRLRAGLTPVYRLSNGADHFYTETESERDSAVAGGYRYEGIAFHVYASETGAQALTPLYRLYHQGYGDHLYTTSATERATARTQGYADEGTIGFIYSFTGGAGEPLLPVFRLLNDATHDHFYTTDAVERDSFISQSGYRREAGIERAGYVAAQPYDLLTAHGLEDLLRQPFNSLPTACRLMNEPVRQVRICIEVLRSYAGAQGIALPASFREAEARYRRTAYQTLLLKLGTSYTALRASRGATADEREALAASLGIPAGDGNQRDYLGELLLDIDAITELDLERLFGLADTTRDPLSRGAKSNDTRGQVTRWHFSGVRWNVNTDPDGCVYVSLSQAAGKTKADVYRAPGAANATLEASAESAVNEDRIALAPVAILAPSSRLGGELDVEFAAAASDIRFQVVPQFVSWRLQALRRQWQDQDWIADAWSAITPAAERLPIIDPDLIGPDDFRNPFGAAGTPFRRTWQARRRWIDDRIDDLWTIARPAGAAPPADDAFTQLFQAMRQTAYAGATATFWPAAAGDRLTERERALQTTDEDALATATQDLWNAFRLTPPMLTQLLGLRKRHDDWVYDTQKNVPLEDAEWREAVDILVQAHKGRWLPAWIQEEDDRGLILGPADFWISLREPAEGTWPPEPLAAGVPRVDPEILKTDDLPDATAGAQAALLWDTRQRELADFARRIADFNRDLAGATNRIKAAFADRNIADIEDQYENLSSAIAADVTTALAYISNTLKWNVESFRKVMDLRGRLAAGQVPQPAKPSEAEWSEMERLLTSAYRQYDRWDDWRDEEDTAGLLYWSEMKARVPRWRASTELRRRWQDALRARSEPAMVDPDLLRETHLRSQRANAASDLRRARGTRVAAVLASFQPQSRTRAGLEARLNEALGPLASAGLPADRDGLQVLLADVREGNVAAARLDQLAINRKALDLVARLHGLLAQTPVQRLTDQEWDEIAAILTQVWKRRQTAAWREEERAVGVTLGPDFFQIPEFVSTTRFPPPQPPEPPLWRGTRSDVADWEDRLQTRIDQENTTRDAVEQAVRDVEELTLPAIRDALVEVCGRGADLAARADWLTTRLLIDARQGGCATTTRIAQAIETIQQVLWGTRTGLLADAYPWLKLVPAKRKLETAVAEFDEAWTWIGSYATWRAAIFVFLYPENILLPSLKRRQTPAFRQLTDDFRGTPRLSATRFAASLTRFYDYFNDVCGLTLQACQGARSNVYEENELGNDVVASATAKRVECLFATTGRGALYWSVVDDTNPEWGQTYWRQLKGFKNDLAQLAGCAVFRTSSRHRFLYLFARTTRDGRDTLEFLRLDLERGGWDADATEIAIDDARTQKSFTVAVKPRTESDEATAPSVYLRYADGSEYLYTIGQRGGTEESSAQPIGVTTNWTGRLDTTLGTRPLDERHIEFSPSRDNLYWHEYTSATSLCAVTLGGAKRVLHYWAQHNSRSWGRTDYPYGQGIAFTRRLCAVGTVANNGITWSAPTAFEALAVPLQDANEIWPVGFAVADIGNGTQDLIWCYLKKISTDVQNHLYGPYITINRTVGTNGIPGTLSTTEFSFSSIMDPLLGTVDHDPNALDLTSNGLKIAIGTNPATNRKYLVLAAATKQRPGNPTLHIVEIDANGPVAGTLKFVAGPSSSVNGVPTGIGLEFASLRNNTEVDAIVFLLMRSSTGETTGEYFVNRNFSFTDPQERWSGPHVVGENVDTWFGDLTGGADVAVTTVNAGDRKDLVVLHDGYGNGSPFGAVDAFYRIGYDIGFEAAPAQSACVHADFKPVSALVPLEFSGYRPLRTVVGDSFQRSRRSRNVVYLEEAFYFTYVLVALKLQQMQEFVFALDWLRLVYDYALPSASRRLVGLAPRTGTTGFLRDDPRIRGDEYDWLLDPLNPHSIAQTRAKTYLRYTLLTVIQCLLDYGDSEFTRDTSETVPRARELYRTALALLYENELKPVSETCEGIRGELEIVFGDRWADYIPELVPNDLHDLETAIKVRDWLKKAFERYADTPNWLEKARAGVAGVEGPPVPGGRVGTALGLEGGPTLEIETAVMTRDPFVDRIERVAEEVPEATDHGGWMKVSQAFCVPQNPMLRMLRLRANLNLYKTHTCRNIAGLKRELEFYAAPTDTVSGLPTIGAGGQLALPGATSLRPTPYRYQVLIERAKQLVQLAAQIEQTFLSALEKSDAESYALLKAKQDLNLSRSGVRLQELRVTVAQGGVKLAGLQRDRAAIQIDTYQQWLSAGLTDLEEALIGLYIASGVQQGIAGVAESAIQALQASSESKYAAAVLAVTAAVARGLQAGLETSIRVAQLYASKELREREWRLQGALAAQDYAIGAQQVEIAEDQVRVAEQERVIAQMQNDNAREVVDFLAGKFTNKELYDWMSDVLERVYSFFLQQATSMAQLAQTQLAFERQEAPLGFIQPDYWEVQAEAASTSAPDRRGLTGSARLLQDIYQLDQYAFDTNKRKLQLTRTLSLSQLAPFEFQRFRETGILGFATPMEVFDRDFPGHYLRLIRRMRTSVIALVPPSEGIRATLSSTGLSRVVVSGGLFQTITLRRDPETVAMSAALNATGLFELEPQPPADMLLPFEGTGVDTQWEFRMLRSSNAFDFSTIADVLVTIDYTALNSFDYYQEVIQSAAMNRPLSGDCAYTFRQRFADAWYDLHNPDQSATPMSVTFRTRREDFPPNLSDLRIQHVMWYAASTTENRIELEDVQLRFTEEGGSTGVGGSATTREGVISTRRGNAGAWNAMIGKLPFGTWELRLPANAGTRELFAFVSPSERRPPDRIADILLVVTYSGRAPSWPQ